MYMLSMEDITDKNSKDIHLVIKYTPSVRRYLVSIDR